MTTVYFVRHAEPNYQNHNDILRELSEKGLNDSLLVTQFLADKNVDVVLSSPYKRAIDTISDFAKIKKLSIGIVDDFRERKISEKWIDNFDTFSRAQWDNFEFKLYDGESLNEVQKRNIAALNDVLVLHKGKTIVIGSHGTALSTIINYYDKEFGYSEFENIRTLMPWIVEFTFDGNACIKIEQYDVFKKKRV